MKLILLAIAGLLFLSACQKSDDSNPPAKATTPAENERQATMGIKAQSLVSDCELKQIEKNKVTLIETKRINLEDENEKGFVKGWVSVFSEFESLKKLGPLQVLTANGSAEMSSLNFRLKKVSYRIGIRLEDELHDEVHELRFRANCKPVEP